MEWVLVKVIAVINIGILGIKQIDPRVLIANENEELSNVEIFLECEWNNTDERKLVIIYLSKEVCWRRFKVFKEYVVQVKGEVE